MLDVRPVAFPVGRSVALALGLILLGMAGWLAAFLGLFLSSAQSGKAITASLFIAICLTVSLALGWFWRRQTSRVLRWDGEHWWLSEAGSTMEQGGEGAQTQIRLDVQHAMLLWFCATGARRGQWLWAQASSDPSRWHLLRCALYLPQSSADSASVRAADTQRA